MSRLVRLLSSNSPHAHWRNKPLLFWALKDPDHVAVLLEHGANPNIKCWLDPDLCVSPLYAVTRNMRRPKDPDMKKLVQDILKFCGARAVRYSDFHIIDIK